MFQRWHTPPRPARARARGGRGRCGQACARGGRGGGRPRRPARVRRAAEVQPPSGRARGRGRRRDGGSCTGSTSPGRADEVAGEEHAQLLARERVEVGAEAMRPYSPSARTVLRRRVAGRGARASGRTWARRARVPVDGAARPAEARDGAVDRVAQDRDEPGAGMPERHPPDDGVTWRRPCSRRHGADALRRSRVLERLHDVAARRPRPSARAALKNPRSLRAARTARGATRRAGPERRRAGWTPTTTKSAAARVRSRAPLTAS